ncbi:MAG: hypothetical protein N2Z72_08115 [Bacteroidales bacterium]|nr:hypothetical protein [Bacteroidales bacterium]
MKNIFIVIFAILMSACGSETKVDNNNKDTSKTLTSSPQRDTLVWQSTYYDDISRFIAGLPVSDTSQFFQLTQTHEWKSYAQQTDSAWKQFEKEKIKVIRSWVSTHLDTLLIKTDTVFYPFSGPDFSYMYAFFPDARCYIMVALEPIGKIPDIQKIGRQLNSFFSTLHQAIYDNLNLSFFITKKMKYQVNNEQIQGTLPLLLFFMARHHLRILQIKSFELNENGQIVYHNDTSFHPRHKFSHGVEITFYNEKIYRIQKLSYLSYSIRNDGFQAFPNGEKFLSRLKNVSTFIKSSSYCPHEDKYSKIRNIILSASKNIVQDDSGVPLKFLKNDLWNLSFFGKYTQTIPVFAAYHQPELVTITAQNEELRFRFGYNPKSLIFVAIKK